MAESIDALEALDVSRPISAETIAIDRDTTRAEDLFRAGFDKTVTQLFPSGGTGVDAPDPRVSFGGVGASEVDTVRTGMMSDVARPGLAPEAELRGPSESDKLVEVANSLYLNMSNYQVAWGVLSGLRRDVQQLLRGQ
ncbi:MAG: hypothetical protein AAF919_12420 [Pseudomonadota bacterium]